MSILDEIVARKRLEVAQRIAETPISVLETSPEFGRACLSARIAIQHLYATGIIAEFKRKSPSKGIINANADVAATTAGYVAAGASVLSVLTDEPFFGGTPDDLRIARQTNPETPILRKDFMIDAYQIFEAKAWGADVILLIAACLTPAEIADLSRQAQELGMQVLLEVHNLQELETSLTHTIDLIGVNNRNLNTFDTAVENSLRLVEQIPDAFVKIAESGLHQPQTLLTLQQAGYDGYLIGEAFMKTSNPAATLAQWVDYQKSNLLNT